MLFVVGNADLTCGETNTSNYQAIICGCLFVTNNASLNAYNYNGSDKRRATLEVRDIFGVNTTGNVYVGNRSASSWEAVTCDILSIINCNNFIAYSTDYTAIEVKNSITIQTKNVIICGEYNREEGTNKTRKGAFTIQDPNKIYLAPELITLASDQAYDEDLFAATPAMMVRTVGEDADNLYTPVASNGYLAPIAKTITFSTVAHSLEKVDAVEPTYTTAGHKEFYQCKDCANYFEEPQGETRILSIVQWLGPNGNGYLAPLVQDFDPYKQAMIEACNNMFAGGDTPEIRALVQDAQAKLSAYVYDESISPAANKAALDNIYRSLYTEVSNVINSGGSSGGGQGVAQTGDALPAVLIVLVAFAALIGAAVYFRKNIIAWLLVQATPKLN